MYIYVPSILLIHTLLPQAKAVPGWQADPDSIVDVADAVVDMCEGTVSCAQIPSLFKWLCFI